jgi:hypothetical protein
LLGDQHLGHLESLQGQFRLAAIDVQHRVDNMCAPTSVPEPMFACQRP